MIIYGRIAVLEALKSEKTFNKLLIEKGQKDKTVQEIINLARENGVKIDFVSKEIVERNARMSYNMSGNQKIRRFFYEDIINRWCRLYRLTYGC